VAAPERLRRRRVPRPGAVRRVRPDEELTLVEHLDELRTRIIVTLSVLAVALAVAFWQNAELLEFIRGPLPIDPDTGRQLDFLATGPAEGFLTSITLAIYAALLVTLPVVTYQLYAFVIPAFSEEHHPGLKPLALLVPVLFFVGVAFAWLLVLPAALDFLLNYNTGIFNYELRAREYVSFVMLTLAAMGIVFELPVVMLVLGRIGLVTSDMMRKHWRVSIVALAFLAVILPGADPITMIVEFVPLIALYWLSYYLVRFSERKRRAALDADGEWNGLWPDDDR
jgi:sec-independent protein translocase protein TatC